MHGRIDVHHHVIPPAFIDTMNRKGVRNVAAPNLIVSGTLERYPRIRWILAHAGGFLPYVAWRATLLNFTPDVSRNAPQGMLASIKRFYFDTALSPSPYAMSRLEGAGGVVPGAIWQRLSICGDYGNGIAGRNAGSVSDLG